MLKQSLALISVSETSQQIFRAASTTHGSSDKQNLFERAESGEFLHVPVKKIRNVEVRPLIFGEGGYPLCNWLVNHFILLQPYSEKKAI